MNVVLRTSSVHLFIYWMNIDNFLSLSFFLHLMCFNQLLKYALLPQDINVIQWIKSV